MPICFKFVSEVHSLFRLTKTYVFDCSIRVLSYSFIITYHSSTVPLYQLIVLLDSFSGHIFLSRDHAAYCKMAKLL